MLKEKLIELVFENGELRKIIMQFDP